MPEQTITPFGRIRITQVIETWAAESPLNPRLLASELAGVLRTIGPESQPLAGDVATVTLFDPSGGSGGLVLLGSLASYFESYSIGAPVATIETTNGTAHAGAVLIALNWIRRLEVEAEGRAKIAAGLVLAGLGAVPSSGSSAQPAGRHQPPPSGSDPECLEIRESQQRREGEVSAAEQLDAERTARNQSEQEASRLRAKLEAIEALLHKVRESIEGLRRELNESERARGRLAEQLIEAEQEAQEAKQKTDEAAASAAAAFSHLEGQLNHVASLFSGRQATPAQGAGLSFPYATKELEAMRAAVATYWESYTPDKRQPTQKEIALTLGEMLGWPQQGNGDAARKAIALASAINPNARQMPDSAGDSSA